MSIPLLNVCRITVSVLAIVCMVLLATRAGRVRRINGDTFAPWAAAALLTAMLFIVIAELRQVGRPLATWWGLPMLALIVLFSLRALWHSKV